ncbi:GNAT family N-acetyltransferase [Flammeovirga sp. EKP202]|uniref:GNAT family N-acetyltransferase n=1 Tax=Flammeovirga sp. EKP202 TaxID=2770592 RepID=UPI00165F3D8F|nr:GNAT family protein [Flammeovirga sp. EKP202]MBD0401491.1 GNAT family N-acetyltransferase [Flammeovirga sp. EKP202]
MNIELRELQHHDIQDLIHYWTKSDPDYLKSLGVDLQKLPPEEGFKGMLEQQIQLPYSEKQNYALIVIFEGVSIGHVNINEIQFGDTAKMHLHLWKDESRRGGIGERMIQLALPLFFEKFELKKLICEPFAENVAPNKTLKKVGFKFIKRYTTVPGSINFEQEVNQWEFSIEG